MLLSVPPPRPGLAAFACSKGGKKVNGAGGTTRPRPLFSPGLPRQAPPPAPSGLPPGGRRGLVGHGRSGRRPQPGPGLGDTDRPLLRRLQQPYVPPSQPMGPPSPSPSSGGAGEQLSKTNLYIRGLHPGTTDQDLVKLCQP